MATEKDKNAEKGEAKVEEAAAEKAEHAAAEEKAAEKTESHGEEKEEKASEAKAPEEKAPEDKGEEKAEAKSAPDEGEAAKEERLKRTVAETPAAKGKKAAPPRKPVKNFFPPRPPSTVEPELKVEKKPALLLAEFESSGQLLHAAERIRDAGYTRWDTHSPFPVHGMDEGMGLPDSRLGWIVLGGGLTGITTAVLMIWWMNGVDYPITIGGKPGFTLPASIPIMFELTVLFSSFAAVFGMLHLNRLPMHYHPIFESDRFRGFSNDKFYVSIDVDDPKYHAEKTKALLEKLHPTAIELVEERTETVVMPEEDH